VNSPEDGPVGPKHVEIRRYMNKIETVTSQLLLFILWILVKAEHWSNILVMVVCVCNSISTLFQAKRDNANMTGTGGGKEVKYNEMDLLILDILGKDNPSVEGIEFADSFQADETIVDQQQAQSPTSVLSADILSPSTVTHEKRNVRKCGVEFLSELVIIFLQYIHLFQCSRAS